jgi:hypothetical protein
MNICRWASALFDTATCHPDPVGVDSRVFRSWYSGPIPKPPEIGRFLLEALGHFNVRLTAEFAGMKNEALATT